MRISRVFAVFAVFTAAVLAVGLMAGTASAKLLYSDQGPAEYPPASFKGKQFVDSRGCIYVRAGYGATVNWVPRVQRNRKLICGYKPTFAKATPPAAAPKPARKPAPKPARVAAATPKPALKPAPKPALKPARVTAPAPRKPRKKLFGSRRPMQTVASITTPPKPMVPAGTAPAKMARPAALARPAPVVVAQTPVLVAEIVMPAVPAPAAVPQYRIPKGYKAAWTDGRLNPDRGVGTALGQAEMDRIWTQTVPRRLIKSAAAHDLALVVARVSTKSVQPRMQPGRAPAATYRPATYRFVQVGTFGNPANARKSAARLQALGLPARMVKTRRKGRVLQIVLAGPFRTQARLSGALSAARRSGFRDAILRR